MLRGRGGRRGLAGVLSSLNVTEVSGGCIGGSRLNWLIEVSSSIARFVGRSQFSLPRQVFYRKDAPVRAYLPPYSRRRYTRARGVAWSAAPRALFRQPLFVHRPYFAPIACSTSIPLPFLTNSPSGS